MNCELKFYSSQKSILLLSYPNVYHHNMFKLATDFISNVVMKPGKNLLRTTCFPNEIMQARRGGFFERGLFSIIIGRYKVKS